jgi:O-6-methylguanine DNA methyltransferase
MTQPTESQIAAMLGKQETPPPTITPRVLVGTALADEYVVIPGPLGPLHIGFTSIGVTSVVPTDDEAEFREVHTHTVGRPAYPATEVPVRLADRLQRSLDSGKLGKLPVDLRQLSRFQTRVLQVTAAIPPAEVRPYGWVAREMGNPGAVRAVGSALARNPVPILIPCHRVVKSDGSVGNYAFGPQMKKDLLVHEGMDSDLFEAGSLRYVGSDTTGIYCFPTCRNARRITSRHRIEFRSSERAEAGGYRACKVCRPAMV